MEINTQQQQNKTAAKKMNESREQENENQGKKQDEAENEIQGKITVTIQNREGQYEATLTAETDRNCPLQKIREKLGLIRYRVPQPPKMMHNIPTHYTTKGLVNGKVLKFDIKKPTKDEQLRNKQTEKTKNSTQERIIESHSEINNAKQSKTNEEQNKTQRKRNSNQINKQDSTKKRSKANQKKSDQILETEESREEKPK